ncbi:Multidrug-efflux transporter 1 regulator [anaerobic digester metagenome]
MKKMKKLYSIGEVSRILNIPTKALRNYDQLNLLKPEHVDGNTKYRYYAYDQFFTIDVIRYLNKVLFVPLEDIRELMGEKKDHQKLLELLEAHKNSLDQKITELEYSKRVTEGLITDIKYRDNTDEEMKIHEAYLLTRNLYYNELDISIYDLDKHVSRIAVDTGHIDNRESNIMCTIYSIADYKSKQALNVKGFGIFSDKKIPGLKSKLIPEGRYLTQRFLYSEENCLATLRNLIRYGHTHHIKLDDTVYLISKMVNVSAATKYDYYMDLQVMRRF